MSREIQIGDWVRLTCDARDIINDDRFLSVAGDLVEVTEMERECNEEGEPVEGGSVLYCVNIKRKDRTTPYAMYIKPDQFDPEYVYTNVRTEMKVVKRIVDNKHRKVNRCVQEETYDEKLKVG